MSASGVSARSGMLGLRADAIVAANADGVGPIGWAGRGLPLLVAVCLLAAPASAAGGALELVPDPLMVLVLVALFLVLILPVNVLLFKPIFRVLDERDSQLEGTRRRAARLQEEAEAVLNRYEDSVRTVREEAEQQRRTRLEEARTEGASTTGSARSQAESEVERARRAISSSLEAARTTLRAEAEDLARQVAARVLGRSL